MNQSEKLTKPYPVRLSPRILAQLKLAAERTQSVNESDVLRLAAEIGLAALAETDYDVPRLVARFMLGQHPAPSPAEIVLETLDRLDRKDEAERAPAPRASSRPVAARKVVR